jgi:hypothetical protein
MDNSKIAQEMQRQIEEFSGILLAIFSLTEM